MNKTDENPEPEQAISVDDPGFHYKREGYQTCWKGEVEPRDAKIAELRSEVEEQARLLGAGGSREAALMAEVERLRGTTNFETVPKEAYDRLREVAQVACDALVKANEFIELAQGIYNDGTQADALRSYDNLVIRSKDFYQYEALSKLSEIGIKPSV